MTRAAVMGAGNWGTAFSKVLADAGTDTVLWCRRPAVAAGIAATGRNPDYLPQVPLPAGLTATADATAALAGADLVVFALPAQHLRPYLQAWLPVLPSAAVLVSLMKGVELGSLQRMTEVMAAVTGAPAERLVVVSGPNLAREIAAEQPAASVVACVDPGVAVDVQAACSAPYFRPYTNPDVVGCELAGAVKNVIALACGMARGMGFGDNTVASLITRGLAEMGRLGVALGADPLTFAGLAGLGDLVATCASPLSRNRTVGERLGRGEPIDIVLGAPRETAEGVLSARPILELAGRNGVDMPITEQVVAVVDDGVSPREMVNRLMRRDPKAEI